MAEINPQFLFINSYDIENLIQLKNGKLLLYNVKGNNNINIYHEKTFQQILNFDLREFLKKEKKENEKKLEDLMDREKNEFDYFDFTVSFHFSFHNIYQKTIKELNNGIILIGADENLIELKLNSNSTKIISCKIVKIFKRRNFIFNINELPNQNILIITGNNIIILNKEKEQYIVKERYQIKENWKLTFNREYYEDFSQYYSSYLLPNNKLLFHSFSHNVEIFGGCGTHDPAEHTNSKIIFINLENFEEIKSTDTFSIYAKIIIFEKIIIIQEMNFVFIYDINTLDIINKIEFDGYYNHLYKYKDNYIIKQSFHKDKNIFIVYRIENNNLIKDHIININPRFLERNRWSDNEFTGYKKFIYFLRDKKFIIIFQYIMYVFEI